LNLVGVDSVDAYQQVLRTIEYRNKASSPNKSSRLIDFVVSDGVNRSATATVTWSDPPALTAGSRELVDLALASEDSWGAPSADVL
jgi:hypothetical protein